MAAKEIVFASWSGPRPSKKLQCSFEYIVDSKFLSMFREKAEYFPSWNVDPQMDDFERFG
nr:hypothetical protein Iba_chr01aCG12820 [Ipomoea batatas]GMC49995.1 hypothetical protein Iba_chr01bCG12850 [Ipomoea batatas]